MHRYKKLAVMSVLSVALVGCGNAEVNQKESVVAGNTVVDSDKTGDKIEDVAEVVAEEDTVQEETLSTTEETDYAHDAGYTELIHGGFSLQFQILMEEIYSRVNYSEVGILVEEITPMDESFMTSVEDMMGGLNPIQDGEILDIVKEARELFDEVNGIVNTKKYEKLYALDEEGQTLYNAYYDWLIETAGHHDHEH